MTCLWLHVGAEKTGSSYIQHMLEGNRNVLIESGISYPRSSESCLAEPGLTSSGNGHIINSWLAGENYTTPGTDCLFSREQLSFEVPNALVEWRDWVAGSEFDEVKALLIVRDPHEWMGSYWSQAVKNNGEFRCPEEFFRDSGDILLTFERAIRACDQLGWDLTIEKYDRDDIPGIVSNWIPGPPLSFPPVTINRSLSASETRAIRTINELLGGKSRPIARGLCDRLPNIRGWKPNIQCDLSLKLKKSIEFVNSRLLNDQQLSLAPLSEACTGEPYEYLSESQKEIIENGLKGIL